MEAVETDPAWAVRLRTLALEEVRWWAGARWWASPGPAAVWYPSAISAGSAADALADVEDVLEATDALWAARRRVSSRVRRLTCGNTCS